MLYPLLKSYVKFGLNWYVTEWQIKNLEFVDQKNPALIVSNHPNSFFDALVIAVHSPAEILFLARGDAFKKPIANWALRTFFMLPIYKKNDDEQADIMNAFTMDECVKELSKGNKILIFPEGVSRNQLTLQPFMFKGMTMLIERAIQRDIPLQIQPYALGYSSFDEVPKAVSIEGMSPIDSTNYLSGPNQVLTEKIMMDLREKLEFNLTDEFLTPSQKKQQKEWMKIPAQIGYYTHNWFYQLVKKEIKKKTEGSIFYDSLLFGVLLFGYPILIFLLSIILGNIFNFTTGFLFFILMPVFSYCWVNYSPIKKQEYVPEGRGNALKK